MKIPTCLCARLRRGGPEAARRSGQSSTARAGDRLSTIVRALLNGLKVLSRAALFRSPGYVAGLRRKRFRSARRRRANFDVRPIVEAGRSGQVAHDQAGCCSESGPSALALALFITALPPPSRADVGQPDHDNVSAAGLQQAPLNEHEPVRGGGAGDAAQGDGDGRGGGAGGGGGGSGGDGRGVGPPAFAAGAVGIITAQRRCATRASGRLSTR